jgi:hypothetical protein
MGADVLAADYERHNVKLLPIVVRGRKAYIISTMTAKPSTCTEHVTPERIGRAHEALGGDGSEKRGGSSQHQGAGLEFSGYPCDRHGIL